MSEACGRTKYTVTFYWLLHCAGKANIKPDVENKHTERNVQSEQPDCQPHNYIGSL